MNFSRRPRHPLRLCALVVLSVGLLFPAGAARATAPASGGVVAWGCPAFADVGECTVPAEASSGVTAIAASDAQSLALKTDGSVLTWGCGLDGGYGQCAVPAEASSGVTAIAAGFAHSLALKQDGSVIAWGCSGFDYGECTVPPAATSGVTAIAAGFSDSLALKQDGSVIAWGCGFPQDSGQCDVPAAASSGVTAIATAYGHSLALKQDGSVIGWGCSLDVGQCNVPIAAQSGVTAIAAGNYSSFALKDGHIIAWGCGGFADYGQCAVPPAAASGVIAVAGGDFHTLALVAPNQQPDCSAVSATPGTLSQRRDQMALITLSGATDPDGDTLAYHIDGVTQDEYVTGIGDDTSPDAALTAGGADSNQVLLRSEANPQFNGRVYRIAYTISDGQGGSCSGTAGSGGTTTAKVSVPRKKGTSAIDDGDVTSWDSFTGAPLP